MFSDITIGQYYPGDSFIHKLDPRVKLFGTMVFIISLFINTNYIGYIVVTVLLITIVKVSAVPFKKLLRGLRGIIFILMISVIFNILLTDGTVLVKIGIFTITAEGLIRGGFLAIRLIYLLFCTSIMTLTTTPNDLADGMEKAFSPLAKIKVPVHEVAMMMSIALRFIPILMEETDKIMKAQKARCADFETGGLIKKAKSMVPLLVPLFVSAIRRALDLAMAMEARCYRGGEGRTKMKPLRYTKNDKKVYVFYGVYFAVIIGINILTFYTEALHIFIVH